MDENINRGLGNLELQSNTAKGRPGEKIKASSSKGKRDNAIQGSMSFRIWTNFRHK
jgi:hypothetical protein